MYTKIKRTEEEKRECKRATKRAYYLRHREEILAKNKARAKIKPEQGRAANARYRAKNPERAREQSLRGNRKHKGAKNPTGERRVGPCEICGEPAEPLCWDHDHESGEFRGWLCHNCNKTLGLMKESVERLRAAANYIEAFLRRREK